jgi:hypothetical protein
MTSTVKRSAIAAVSALALALGVMTTASTPAAAFGWHGGGGGWHGGGWHGGWGGGGWRGGYWRGGGWGWGGGWGAPVAAGLLGGLAVGAIAGSAYPYGPYGGYGGCYLQNQPVYNGWGQFVGYRPVRVCY